MSYSYEEQKETLRLIHKILKDNNFLKKMNLAFGTLLGAVRQGKLNTSINDWDDLDFCVTKENFEELKDKIIPLLLENGFEIKYVWYTSFDKIGEITLYRGKDRLDINQVFPYNKNGQDFYIHCHWYGNLQLSKGLRASYYTDIKKIMLEDLEFYGPAETEEHMIDCYGDSWKVPCKTDDEYKYWLDEPGVPWWDRTPYLKMTDKL